MVPRLLPRTVWPQDPACREQNSVPVSFSPHLLLNTSVFPATVSHFCTHLPQSHLVDQQVLAECLLCPTPLYMLRKDSNKTKTKPQNSTAGLVVPACNPSVWTAEAGRSKPVLHNQTLSQNKHPRPQRPYKLCILLAFVQLIPALPSTVPDTKAECTEACPNPRGRWPLGTTQVLRDFGSKP